MELAVYWHSPVSLVDGRQAKYKYASHYIYACDDDLPTTPGVYMFGRFYGGGFTPLYIGKAGNIAKRVWQHFKGNVALMNRIKNDSKNGRRVVIAGEFHAKPGQRWEACVTIIEDALIRRALAEGHEIFNISGATIRTHQIERVRGSDRTGGFVPRTFEIER